MGSGIEMTLTLGNNEDKATCHGGSPRISERAREARKLSALEENARHFSVTRVRCDGLEEGQRVCGEVGCWTLDFCVRPLLRWDFRTFPVEP